MTTPFFLVAGCGQTGRSIARYLQRRNLPFVVFDTRKEVPGLNEYIQDLKGVDIFLGDLPFSLYDQLTTIIASPGLSLDEPIFVEARRRAIPIIGDVECFAQEVKAPVIAITGTNGKSTVTTLVGEMAKTAGLRVAIAGNIGLPVLDLLDNGEAYDLWVLELSSFQLELLYSLSPRAAAILNISPDHLDRHHHLAAYIGAKQRIYHQAQHLIFNRDDLQTLPATSYQAPLISHGLDESPRTADWGLLQKDGKIYLAKGHSALIAVDKLILKGKQNWQNALAACALASTVGIGVEPMIKTLQTFSGLPHRCQWIRTLDGVDWINDSKGTNIGATISAISGVGGSIQGKIVLIAGGLGKGADFTELRSPIQKYVRAVVVIGTDGIKIAKALTNVVTIFSASSLENAVLLARQEAKAGDVVLLSPACASQDMFRDFNHRGDIFIQLINSL